MSFAETPSDTLARLRRELEQARTDLIEAEAELTDRLADLHAFEFEFEAHVGHLLDRLSQVEAEVNVYLQRIQRMRDEQTFGQGYRSVEEQFRRTWQTPRKDAPPPPPPPPPPETEAQIKKLYRKLARRYHPDLAADDSERAFRTGKMAAINDAYAARSLVELMAMAREMRQEGTAVGHKAADKDTDQEMIRVLEGELTRCRRRLREIDNEIQNLHNHSMVELALEVKLARRQGRDLLAEMAAELEKKIARKSVELDMLKSQFDNLDRGGSVEIGHS